MVWFLYRHISCNDLIFHFCRPHFTQCADAKVEALSDALQTTVTNWKGRIPMPLSLELYTSSTFIGLFVEEQMAEVLKTFASDFATEATSKAGLSLLYPFTQDLPFCSSKRVSELRAFVLIKTFRHHQHVFSCFVDLKSSGKLS